MLESKLTLNFLAKKTKGPNKDTKSRPWLHSFDFVIRSPIKTSTVLTDTYLKKGAVVVVIVWYSIKH